MNATRRALSAAALSAAVLLGTVGAATAQTPGITTHGQAIAAIDEGQAQVDAGQARIKAGRDWLAANPPAAAPSPSTPPAPSAATAAERFGWGSPIAAGSDEFNGNGRPDPGKWVLPNGCFAGHAGQGRRCAANSTVANGSLTQVGMANGDTGWMQSRHNSYRGRWETRMRVVPTSGRSATYNPVILLWPVAEDFPRGGEVDYSESRSTGRDVSFFLHYGANNSQTGGGSPEGGRRAVDLTQWHTYAVQWGESCMIGYLDGEEWFRDCSPSHLPPRAMKSSIQLDWFPRAAQQVPGETMVQVDWHRAYAAP